MNFNVPPQHTNTFEFSYLWTSAAALVYYVYGWSLATRKTRLGEMSISISATVFKVAPQYGNVAAFTISQSPIMEIFFMD